MKCKNVFDSLDKKTGHKCSFILAMENMWKYCYKKVNAGELNEREYYCEKNTILLKCNKCPVQVYGQNAMRDHHEKLHRNVKTRTQNKV